MNKLISANFARLFKNGAFILYMIFSGGLSAFMIFLRYADYHKNMEYYDNYLDPEYHTMDGIAFVGLLYLLFAVPVFVGNFVCTEYSDGTIRNKLIVGHKRIDIYLANLVVCTAGTLMGVLLHLLINFTLGTALCGIEVLTVSKILELTLFGFIAFVSLTAIIVMVSMLVKSKAGASVTTLIATFIMFFATISLNNMLDAPEYYENSFNPNTMETETIKNPDYLAGTKRKVYQTIYDVMPVSHMYESAMTNTKNAGKFAGYDGIILVATTALGIILFRKKDLK
ncbi:MAG: ABC transporter permease [Prevotella sp.]|nr:ABC transporter permease [Alistipes senegalensis]MCM1357430.1 ABC transporter permease [Prevotella sp.]MCM1473141.1 ABC transporter permease [Muribaculaceae bacterium]